MAKPRILFLNRSYFPDAEATGQLLTQLCDDLALQFDVEVISGQPNSNPSGCSFVRVGRERRNGVTIRRVWNTQFAKSSTLGRLLNWFSYLGMATLAAVSGRRPNIVVVETDPPLLCLLGALLRCWFGCQLVVYLQDMYPDVGVALKVLRNGPATRLLRKSFFKVYRTADQVVVLSDDMQRVLVESGVEPSKIKKIPNWVDCSHVVPMKQENPFRNQLGLTEKFVVMHSGNLGFCQRLDNLLDAAEQLLDQPHIEFVLVGDGASRNELRNNASRRGLHNVRFVEYQPAARLSESLSAADVHVVSVDRQVIGYLMPSKLYGVLASGTPVIAVAPAGCELAQIVEREKVGYVVEPGVPTLLAAKVSQMAGISPHFEKMGERARQLAVSRFDRRISVDAFATLLVDLFAQANETTIPAVSERPQDDHLSEATDSAQSDPLEPISTPAKAAQK